MVLNKIKSFFNSKNPLVDSELSFHQLDYLQCHLQEMFFYIPKASILDKMGLISEDLKSIKEGKESFYLNHKTLSTSDVVLKLNFDQLCLLYLPVGLVYPDWEVTETNQLLSLANPYLRGFMRHLYHLTISFTQIPDRSETHLRVTLSESEYRHLYTNVVWYIMTQFRYINFGKDIGWNWDELFTLLLEEICFIGTTLFPFQVLTPTDVIDLDSRRGWKYPMNFLESISASLKDYTVAPMASSKDHWSCFDCSADWSSDAIQLFIHCPKCNKPFLNPFYLDRVKDKALKGTGTWCIAYEKNPDNTVTLSLHLEHFFMLLVIVLTSPSFMHTLKDSLSVFNFEEDVVVKRLFIQALCILLEER